MCKLRQHEAISQLLASVRSLIDSWWRVDRIRASPREGRLLRIEPGTIVTIHGEMLEITARNIRDTPRGTIVCYTANSKTGDCQLWTAPDASDVIVLRSGDTERRFAAVELEVWGADSRSSKGILW